VTVIGPITCRCGLQMRIAEARDACECRCGLWVGGEIVHAAAGAPISGAAFQQGEPWKEREPGIVISDKFGDIMEPIWDASIEVDPAKFSDAASLQRACADAFESSGLRYVGKVEPMASRDLTIDGEIVKRHHVYALVPVGQEDEAVRGVVQFIQHKHGPGRVWAHGDIPIGPLKRRSDAGHRGAEVGGILHVVMGCYYFHRPFSMREQGGALYIDTKHGPIKVTADPTLRPDEIAFAQPGAGQADYHLPAAGGWKLPEGCSPARVAYREPIRQFKVDLGRPDGFDQRQVDAARTALLAPASPRYPRSR